MAMNESRSKTYYTSIATDNPYSPSIIENNSNINRNKQYQENQFEMPYSELNYDSSMKQSYEDYAYSGEHYVDNNDQDLEKKYEKPKYADSYFYNSSVYKYPTINEQKALAKVIASTLEKSNPESKYHKYKNRQVEFEDHKSSFESYSNDQDFINSQNTYHTKYAEDENLPDMIRNSIRLAEISNPFEHVQASDEFIEQHFIEHNTHTQMPPQIAMSLAASLNHGAGRGAEIFQRRRAKSERWVIGEKNNNNTNDMKQESPEKNKPMVKMNYS